MQGAAVRDRAAGPHRAPRPPGRAEPCHRRRGAARPRPSEHDVIVAAVPATARGHVGVVTITGPADPALRARPARRAAQRATRPPCRAARRSPSSSSWAGRTGRRPGRAWTPDGPGLALGTAQGVVKRVAPDVPAERGRLGDDRAEAGDSVVGAVGCPARSHGTGVRHQRRAAAALRRRRSTRRAGRRAAWPAIRLGRGASVIWFGAVDPDAARRWS